MSFILMSLNAIIINPWPEPTDKRLSVRKMMWLVELGDI